MPLVGIRTSLVVATLSALCAAAPASAATRHAAPGATGPEPCAATAPCALEEAVGNAADGDSVVLGSGSYGSPATRLTVPVVANDRIEVAGEAGQPRPVLYLDAPNAFQLDHPDASLRWVEIDNAGGGSALVVAARLAEQVVVHSSAVGGVACGAIRGTIRNSVCRTTGANAAAVGFAGGGLCGDAEPQPDSVLRGVTAWAAGPNSNGISVRATCSIQKRVLATNTLVRGTARDVFTQSDSNANTLALVETNHSNLGTRTSDGLYASVTETATQNAAPALVNPAAGDFRQLADSRTIGAGTDSADNGAHDFEGTVRAIQGTDIGADEFLPPPGVTTGASDAVGIDTATVSGAVVPLYSATTYLFEYGPTAAYGQTTPVQDAGQGPDPVAVSVSANLAGLTPNTNYHYRLVATNAAGSAAGADQTFTTRPLPPPPAPVLTGLAVGPKAFAIGSKMPALLAARKKKRPPVGTTIRFTLNRPATVKLSFTRFEAGRRVGSKCRAASRSNRSKPRCTRRVAVRGTVSVNGRAGLNRVRFQGRLTRRERLAYGAHELAAVATDLLSRSSAPARTGFRVVRR